MRKQIIHAIAFIIVGIAIGLGGSLLYNQRHAKATTIDYHVVVGPTRAAKLEYWKDGAGYTFTNKQHALCVIVLHNDAYSMYALRDLPAK